MTAHYIYHCTGPLLNAVEAMTIKLLAFNGFLVECKEKGLSEKF